MFCSEEQVGLVDSDYHVYHFDGRVHRVDYAKHGQTVCHTVPTSLGQVGAPIQKYKGVGDGRKDFNTIGIHTGINKIGKNFYHVGTFISEFLFKEFIQPTI